MVVARRWLLAAWGLVWAVLILGAWDALRGLTRRESR